MEGNGIFQHRPKIITGEKFKKPHKDRGTKKKRKQPQTKWQTMGANIKQGDPYGHIPKLTSQHY